MDLSQLNYIETYMQKYAVRSYFNERIWHNIKNMNYKHNVEITVTFNRDYYNLMNACKQCKVICQKIMRQVNTTRIKYEFEVCQEYHKDGWPHLHIGIYSNEFLQNEKGNLWQIISRSCQMYGLTTIYHNEKDYEHKYHEFDKVKQHKYKVEGMYWSDYIRKDVVENGEGHYFNMIVGYKI